MDRRERSGDLLAALIALQEGIQSTLWTALPGIIQSFDAAKRTVVVQPTIQAQVMSPDGATVWTTLPLLLDCPVVFPQGGGVTLTFPLALGDECLVVFASRCIDAWWQSGGVQPQAELRMHDLSDGFAIAGIRSKPSVEAAIRTDRAELRSLDGLARISLYPGTKKLEMRTTGDIELHAANISLVAENSLSGFGNNSVSLNSSVQVLADAPQVAVTASALASMSSGSKVVAVSAAGTASISGGTIIDGHDFDTHEHSGVVFGTSNTGGVV